MIPRYLPIDPKKKPGRMLIFCDVLKGELDPYRGESIDDAPLDYLKNGLKLDPKNLSKLFDYYLSFVDSPTPVFALDAALELRKVDRPDLLKIVKKHHAKRLRESRDLHQPGILLERCRHYCWARAGMRPTQFG